MYILIFIELNSPSYFLHQPSDISPSSPHSVREQKRIQPPNSSHFRRIRGEFFVQTIRILASWIFCLVLNSSVNGEKGYYSVLRQQSMCYVPVPVSPII